MPSLLPAGRGRHIKETLSVVRMANHPFAVHGEPRRKLVLQSLRGLNRLTGTGEHAGRQGQKDYSAVTAAGGQVKVVMQSTPESVRQAMGGENRFPFDIICDPERSLWCRPRPPKSTHSR